MENLPSLSMILSILWCPDILGDINHNMAPSILPTQLLQLGRLSHPAAMIEQLYEKWEGLKNPGLDSIPQTWAPLIYENVLLQGETHPAIKLTTYRIC